MGEQMWMFSQPIESSAARDLDFPPRVPISRHGRAGGQKYKYAMTPAHGAAPRRGWYT